MEVLQMETKVYLTAKEVAEILGISKSKAYQIIRKLNFELENQGYIVISGKISLKFLQEKYYGLMITN